MPLIEGRLYRNIDKTLLFAVFVLMAFSIAAVYAATFARGGGIGQALRQGIYFAVGLGVCGLVASRDYANLPRYVPYLYGVNIALLVAVELFSPEVKGAARWIQLPIPGMDFKLQPSEFAKILTIITLSCHVAQMESRIRQFPYLLLTLAHIALPTLLIMKQPDLGTSLVIVVIWAGIVFVAGAKWQHLVGLAAAGILLFGFAWQFNLLKSYQKERVHTFINPLSDPKGKGYHVLQSLVAIGGGSVRGQGYLKGLQTNNRFIPENHTDFIFTVVGEETGFVGGCVLLSIYGVILYRGCAIAAQCDDPLGRLIASGVVSLLAFHLLVNIGMTTGIMPVVGVPLPLMSFGGSAAWANLAGIGLLFGIGMRKHKLLF
ncbi:MAG: rod shape-determining protein RodA [Fibrella sp.]|nr:rod shape-determining protein RodA [Armatimonadota bacterium]